MTGYDDIAASARAYQQARALQDSDGGAATEAILRTRVALAESLIAAGWTPPPAVDAHLTADRRLLLLATGIAEQRRPTTTTTHDLDRGQREAPVAQR